MNKDWKLQKETIKSNLENTEKALSDAHRNLAKLKEAIAESRKKRGALNNDESPQITYSREQFLRNLKYETTWVTLGLILVIFLFGGFILEMTFGKTFIFVWANAYRDVQIKLFFVLLPITAVIYFRAILKKPETWKKFSTRKLNWLLFPLISACLAILPLVAPLGWAALSGRMIGSNSLNMEARIISVKPKNNSSKRSCTQRAELEFRGNSAELCIDGLIVGETPQPNEKVLIAGKTSWFGIYIQQIRTHPQ